MIATQLQCAAEDDSGHIPVHVKKLCADAAAEIDQLRTAASLALWEMRHTVAPRNSFTDAIDALDAALNKA